LQVTDQVILQFSTTVNSWGNRWSWVIRHLCNSPFSHVDMVMPDGNLLGASDSPRAPVVSGNSRGVAIRPPDYEAYGLRLRMVINTPKADLIRAVALTQLGKPFDNSALYGFLSDALPGARPWGDPTSWFCSELIIWSFLKALYWNEIPLVWPQNRVSPPNIFMIFLFDQNWVNRDTFWGSGHKAMRYLRA
jgi:hypothetical protein